MAVSGHVLMAIGRRLAVGVAISAVGGLAWWLLAGGSYVQKFGAVMILVGFVLMMAPSGVFTRISMMDTNMWLGRGPDRPDDGPSGGDATLTRLGSFLFVAIPLVTVGFLLA